jgi:hypothetical protein
MPPEKLAEPFFPTASARSAFLGWWGTEVPADVCRQTKTANKVDLDGAWRFGHLTQYALRAAKQMVMLGRGLT